jgi:hypothetical protein
VAEDLDIKPERQLPPGAPVALASPASPGGGGPPDEPPENTPGAQPPTPPPPPPTWAARAAALQAEYVAGGAYPFLSQYLRSLPHHIDDTTRDFGDDLYDRMLLDGQVSSGIRLLKEETLANGIRLEPAVQRENQEWILDEPDVLENIPARDLQGRFRKKSDREAKADEDRKKEEADADLAEEITDFCEQTLLHLDRPLIEVLDEMLDGLALGNKLAEQVYETRRDEDNKPKLYLKNLKVKPRKVTAYVMDPFMNIVGILATLPGQAFPVLAGSVVSQTTQIPNMLPREKFMIFTWGGRGGDPRGSSLLRQVYNPWWLKLQTWGEYAKYLVKFAGPALVGYTAPNAQSVPPTDSLGNPIPGAPLITPEQAMLAALLNFAQGQAVVFTAGSKVEPLTMSGDGSAYRGAIDMFNKEITKGILCQTLATETGVHMTRAASETHQDVLDIVVLHIKALVAAMLYKDVLYPLVRYNWGEDIARRLTPRVHLAQVQAHNWARDAAAVAALTTSQYLDNSQKPELDARLGLPKRSPASLAAGPAGPPPGMANRPGVPLPGGAGGIRPPAGSPRPPVTAPGQGRNGNGSPFSGGAHEPAPGAAEFNDPDGRRWVRNPDYRPPKERLVIR